MDARTLAFYDQHDAWLRTTVRRQGWAIQYVAGESCDTPACGCPPADGPSFAYTVGLFGLDHPELLILGIDPPTAAAVLNELGGAVRAGSDLLPGQLVTLSSWARRVVPEVVPNPHEIVFQANDFYRLPEPQSVPVLQLTYDDEAGRFPWDDGFADPRGQPRPGTFTA